MASHSHILKWGTPFLLRRKRYLNQFGFFDLTHNQNVPGLYNVEPSLVSEQLKYPN